MSTGVFISLGADFVLMLAIGVYGYLKTDKDVTGFMLGGRKLSPAVTALSAGASDMSGWMLLGLPGLIYAVGLSGSWIAIAWRAGGIRKVVCSVGSPSHVAKGSIIDAFVIEKNPHGKEGTHGKEALIACTGWISIS